MRNYILLLCLGLIVLAGCRNCKDKEDPCPSTRRTNANFFVYEWDGGTNPKVAGGGGDYLKKWWGASIDTDTICTNWAEFVPEDMNADRYEWVIGLDTFTSKTVSLAGFNNGNPNGVSIPVQLKVWKTPDRNCFPDDSGFAMKNRKLQAYNLGKSLLYDQPFLITLDNGDTMTFRVYFRTGFPGSDWYFTTGISKGELPTPLGSMAVGFNQMAFNYLRYTGNPNNPVDGGLGLIGVRIDPSNRIKIIGNYELTKKNQKELDKRGTFTGIRK
jgi:hypothetical protein